MFLMGFNYSNKYVFVWKATYTKTGVKGVDQKLKLKYYLRKIHFSTPYQHG